MFGVLVTSSDDRRDIFLTCFAHSERIWKDCDWPRYAGFTTPQVERFGFKPLTAWGTYGTQDWCRLVAAHVYALPPSIEYILLMVEDTLFVEPVDMAKLARIGNAILEREAVYTRLVPLRRTWFNMPPMGNFDCLDYIPLDHPYYSSTEMTIWRRDYLLELLNKPGDAWSFEHRISNHIHWVVREPIFNQHQIVQKGYWNWDAPRLLKKAGLLPPPPGRPYQTLRARLRGHRENLSFALFGFTGFKVRRWLRGTA